MTAARREINGLVTPGRPFFRSMDIHPFQSFFGHVAR
jgi:hypothetical protein